MSVRTPFHDLYRVVDENGCWIWQLSLNEGYGHIGRRDYQGRAHRWMWLHLRGPIPEGLQVDHLCRVRACVNPDHMELVTGRVNVLRGIGQSAVNARKVECKNGHPFDGANTYWYRGHRGCRPCRCAAVLRAYHRDPEKAREWKRQYRARSQVTA